MSSEGAAASSAAESSQSKDGQYVSVMKKLQFGKVLLLGFIVGFVGNCNPYCNAGLFVCVQVLACVCVVPACKLDITRSEIQPLKEGKLGLNPVWCVGVHFELKLHSFFSFVGGQKPLRSTWVILQSYITKPYYKSQRQYTSTESLDWCHI